MTEESDIREPILGALISLNTLLRMAKTHSDRPGVAALHEQIVMILSSTKRVLESPILVRVERGREIIKRLGITRVALINKIVRHNSKKENQQILELWRDRLGSVYSPGLFKKDQKSPHGNTGKRGNKRRSKGARKGHKLSRPRKRRESAGGG